SARYDVEDRLAVLGARGDVEEAEFVGAGGVISLGRLHRIAGIDQVDEIDALDHSTVLDVEAGDNAGLEGHLGSSNRAGGAFFPRRIASASEGSTRPS